MCCLGADLRHWEGDRDDVGRHRDQLGQREETEGHQDTDRVGDEEGGQQLRKLNFNIELCSLFLVQSGALYLTLIGGFGSLGLCLYGIRELAYQNPDTNQSEHSIWMSLDQ